LYFTKEVFDGTYPGYGSSYPDLQGGLGILFEQASSRGHLQKTDMGEMSFAFTIRNQFATSRATVQAAVENKNLLHEYQKEFFKSALSNARSSKIKGYVFGDADDENRTRAFIDKLLLHRIECFQLSKDVELGGKKFKAGSAYVVPTEQVQYRMVQTMFETYSEFQDSVFYDASAWSMANFYNMPYASSTGSISRGDRVTSSTNMTNISSVKRSEYGYLASWNNYNAPGFLNQLLTKGILVNSAFKPFSIKIGGQDKEFSYGTLMIPCQKQKISQDSLLAVIQEASSKWKVEVDALNTGYSSKGVDLGSRYFNTIEKPKALLLVGQSVSSYEAGEVWHLLDQRVHMPITKLPLRNFGRANLDEYNTLVMVSGSYPQLDSLKKKKLKDWATKGNTLITIREASKWLIKNKLVKDSLITKKKEKDPTVKRADYVGAPEELGRERIGGAIFEVDLDITHPLGFGYARRSLPVYRNSRVFLKPSKNAYCTVARYTEDPHIDGFVTKKNMEEFLKPSASLIVSPIGKGRAIMFADNPNFRGSWYGTNRMFLNALFLGNHIRIPKDSGGHVHE
ncbi:MAG: zinc carboxypeptidase, partial [Saprospiraceae bacterium]|nr:zinc carboxypeptidase [Saprospiraceae bacterium]